MCAGRPTCIEGRFRHCPTASINYGSRRRPKRKAIEAQPARGHENLNGLAMEALSVAWPCQVGWSKGHRGRADEQLTAWSAARVTSCAAECRVGLRSGPHVPLRSTRIALHASFDPSAQTGVSAVSLLDHVGRDLKRVRFDQEPDRAS